MGERKFAIKIPELESAAGENRSADAQFLNLDRRAANSKNRGGVNLQLHNKILLRVSGCQYVTKNQFGE